MSPLISQIHTKFEFLNLNLKMPVLASILINTVRSVSSECKQLRKKTHV